MGQSAWSLLRQNTTASMQTVRGKVQGLRSNLSNGRPVRGGGQGL